MEDFWGRMRARGLRSVIIFTLRAAEHGSGPETKGVLVLAEEDETSETLDT